MCVAGRKKTVAPCSVHRGESEWTWRERIMGLERENNGSGKRENAVGRWGGRGGIKAFLKNKIIDLREITV